MSKFLIICVFLLSFVAVSFCDLIPLPKGTYEFKSNENEKALLYVDSKSLLMLTIMSQTTEKSVVRKSMDKL